MEKVSIIIPVVRTESAERCVRAIKEYAPEGRYEIVVEQDIAHVGCPEMVKRLTEKAKYDLVMFLGDDTVPGPGFLDAAVTAMAVLPDSWGVVGLNTEDPRGSNPLAHWMAHKKMLDYTGGDFFSTEYRHCWCDNELRDIAEELGRWVFAENARIEHRHPINKSAENDEHYQRAYSEEAKKYDKKTYFFRKIERSRIKNNGLRLGIGWPITDSMIHTNFVTSFIAMKKPAFDFFVPQHRGRIDAVRNDIVEQALQEGVTHLWMTDTDQIYFDDDILSKMLSHEVPIVTLPIMRRYPPFDPMLWRKNGDGEHHEVSFSEIKEAFEKKKTLEIDVTGAGSILFDMRVFVETEPPWFKLPEYGERGPGEDIYFWNKAHNAGYKILVDCSVNVEHLTAMGVGWNTHLLFRKLNHMEGKENGK